MNRPADSPVTTRCTPATAGGQQDHDRSTATQRPARCARRPRAFRAPRRRSPQRRRCPRRCAARVVQRAPAAVRADHRRRRPRCPGVASRLNGAPPTGASDRDGRCRRCVADLGDRGNTIRRTAGRISRSGSSVGSAISVIRPPLSPVASTATRTIGITDDAEWGVVLCVIVCDIADLPFSWSKSRVRWPSGNHCPVRQCRGEAFDRGGDRQRRARRERRHPFAVERPCRAHHYTARGGVDDADADVGADAMTVAVVACDDLHVGAAGRSTRPPPRVAPRPGCPGTR